MVCRKKYLMIQYRNTLYMFIDPLLGQKIVYILGITNIVSIILVFFSCRCLLGWKLTARLARFPWFQKFYRYHCWYWWLFIVSVFAHSVIALLIFGNPF